MKNFESFCQGIVQHTTPSGFTITKIIWLKNLLHPFLKLRDPAENSYTDDSVLCQTITKQKLFKVLNFIDQYQCILFVCFIKKCSNGFQDIFVVIIAKLRFYVYLFTFVVAIYSSSPDIKLTFATKPFLAWLRNLSRRNMLFSLEMLCLIL